MPSKRSPTSQQPSGSSRRASNSGRRRKISLSKSSPGLHVLEPIPSPSITLDQATPIQTGNSWPFTTQTVSHNDNERLATRKSRSSSNSSSSSASSASNGSSADSGAEIQAPSTHQTATAVSMPNYAPPPRSKSHTSLPRTLSAAHLANFAPPFYNRPPTPLPPSPSLTSLLRPSFSAAPSRPTTPDDSEVEGTPQTGKSYGDSSTTTINTALGVGTDRSRSHLLQTARTAQPLPRASPKVPTYEYYGFVLYLTSSLFFLGYVLWSYLPSPFLHRLGIYYYPDRWWSLALPAWIVMAVLFVYVCLAGYNVEVLTLPLGSLGAVVDQVGVVAVIDPRTGKMVPKGGVVRDVDYDDAREKDWKWRDCWSEGTDAVLDVPLGGVCEVLYGDG